MPGMRKRDGIAAIAHKKSQPPSGGRLDTLNYAAQTKLPRRVVRLFVGSSSDVVHSDGHTEVHCSPVLHLVGVEFTTKRRSCQIAASARYRIKSGGERDPETSPKWASGGAEAAFLAMVLPLSGAQPNCTNLRKLVQPRGKHHLPVVGPHIWSQAAASCHIWRFAGLRIVLTYCGIPCPGLALTSPPPTNIIFLP